VWDSLKGHYFSYHSGNRPPMPKFDEKKM